MTANGNGGVLLGMRSTGHDATAVTKPYRLSFRFPEKPFQFLIGPEEELTILLFSPARGHFLQPHLP